MFDQDVTIRCDCKSSCHQLRFMQFPDDAEFLYVDFFICNYLGFWKRLWLGIKYICGCKSDFGHFDSILLSPNEAIKIQEQINIFLEKNKNEIRNT